MRFFSLESPLMKFMTKMTDLLWINILTILLCIPIVTAGAAFTSMHYVCLKIVRDEEGYITKDYFKSFARNFKQSTIIWLIAAVLIVVLFLDFRFIPLTKYQTFMYASITAAAIFLYVTILYVFPVLSHFENTVKGTIKNAFFMSILALPKTVLMVLVSLVPLGLIYLVERFQTMFWIVPMTTLFWFSAPAYFNAKLYDKLFKRFEPEKEDENDDFTWTVGGAEENAENAENVPAIETSENENTDTNTDEA